MRKKSVLRRLAVAVLDLLDLHSSVLLRRQGPLFQDGWFISFRRQLPVDAAGRPIPWLTYPAIDFLAPRIDRCWQVFEYGCGHGTLWWAARVSRVDAVEHDPEWAATIRRQLPSSASVTLVAEDQAEQYADSIFSAETRFDVVVVDGVHRQECLRRVPELLSAAGVVILDNSERPEYHEDMRALRAKGFRQVDFWGLVPAVCWKSCTSIFYRDGNCFGL